MAERIPRKMKFESIELPPKETNGKVTPTIGTIPIFMPILTKKWMSRKDKLLTIIRLSNVDSDRV